MSNIYHATICEKCKKPITTNTTIMTHGADNLNLALKLLKDCQDYYTQNNIEIDIEKIVSEVKEQFCAHCCGHIPCGCSQPSPQA